MTTHLWYDGPRLISWEDEYEDMHLAVNYEGDHRGDWWMYVVMSKSRWGALERHEIDLHDAFSDSEYGVVDLYKLPHLKYPESYEVRHGVPNPSEDMLPDKGTYLD